MFYSAWALKSINTGMLEENNHVNIILKAFDFQCNKILLYNFKKPEYPFINNFFENPEIST